MKDKSDWFTVERIDDSTYALSEYGHWEQVHSYLVIGSKSACLIDTGLGIGNIKEVVEHLTDLPIQVVTTHVHWDHIGGHRYFDEIKVHKNDSTWLKEGIPIPLKVIRKNVIQEPLTKTLPKDFDIEKYYPYQGLPSLELEDGDVIDLGNRLLQVIHTPGHSPGHICIYEEERGYIFTGDLLYQGTLFAFYPSTDPILLANSIEKLTQLEYVEKILPGHNDLNIPVNLINGVNTDLQELKEKGLLHHGSGVHKVGSIEVKF